MGILQFWISRTVLPFHMSQQIIDDRFWGGQFKAVHLCLGVGGTPFVLPHPCPHHQGELSSTALARQPNTTMGRRQGKLSCSHAPRAGLPAPVTPEPAPPCCPVKAWRPYSPKCCFMSGHLYYVSQEPCRAYSTASGGQGGISGYHRWLGVRWGGHHPPPSPLYYWTEEGSG